jgi:predicted amidophosphoribosyltransferase
VCDLARKNQNDELLAPKDQFNAYKKEIGKQYMDGLISDKEYEKLLHDKEIELGLNAPVTKDLDEGPECPSCGALINGHDTECMICGVSLETVLEKEVPKKSPEMLESEEMPPEVIQKERICGSCGAVVSEVDTICVVCGSMLGTLTKADELGEPAELVPIELDIPEVSSPKIERACPSCGAFVENDAIECMICETPFEAVAAITSVPAEKPLDAMEEAPTPKMPEKTLESERVCPSCGAFMESDATECMICETPLGAVAPVIPVPESGEMPLKVAEEMPVPTEEEEMPEKIPTKAEIVCAGCGAVLDEGSEECFICGAKIGQDVLEEITPPHKVRIEDVSPEPIPIDHDLPPIEDEVLKEVEAESPATTEEPVQEIVLGENEIMCPSCSSVIPMDSEKCPECWNDLSLYVKCPACSLLTPIGDDNCRECFAPLGKAEPAITTIEDDTGILDLDSLDITTEVEITEELKEVMTALEVEEEQGKECLVCGAIFGPDDQLCPICGIEYGIEIEEPKMPETAWDHLEVEIAPIIHTCPSCGENVTGLEATDREIDEGKWFYRGLVAIFTGIFFTSFSIYARGVSAESASLGFNPPPTDVLLNLVGWIMVIFGFWLLSWKLHDDRTECPDCGIETEPNMAICINCGTELMEPEEEEETREEEAVDEGLLPEEEENVLDQYNLLSQKPLQYEMPSEKSPQEEMPEDIASDLLDEGTSLEIDETLEVPPPEIPKKAQPAPVSAPAVKAPEHFTHGEELPVEHEEHKKCPGCGIFVDLNDSICPICDTEFAVPKPIPDKEIEVPSEEDELANLEPMTETSIDNITVPKDSPSQIECPSCGASLESGTKACPVCEYPLD